MKRILVVEDDFGSRKMMQKLLEEFGAVDVAVDGQEGLELFTEALEQERRYDIVFLDIMMPRMDGHEALAKMREEERARGIQPSDETPVLMTTVLEDPHNVVGAYFKGGATSYLVKPVERLVLRAELAKLGFKPRS